MVTKSKAKPTKKRGGKGQVKTLDLKRETIKDVSSREQKKVKGGGGLSSGVIQGRVVDEK